MKVLNSTPLFNLDDWFYNMSILVSLFHVKFSLTVLVSNYIQYKMYFHHNFTLENTLLRRNINMLKTNVVLNHFKLSLTYLFDP